MEDESNPLYYIIHIFKLLYTLYDSNSVNDSTYDQKLLSYLGSIFRSGATGKIFLFFIRNGAATAWTLQHHLSVSEARVYSSLRNLCALGMVEQIRTIRRVDLVRGGPKPKVWGLIGCEPQEVAEAIVLHRRSKSPKYLHAEEVAQAVMKSFTKRGLEEISWRELLIEVRRHEKPYHIKDIADITSTILSDRGFKVWG